MRKVLALATSLSVLSALSTLSGSCPRAFADPAPGVAGTPHPDPRRIDPIQMVTDDCARARKAGQTCELTLTPEDVAGQLPLPDDIALRSLPLGAEGSLLRIRHDFVVEIVRSADDQ